MSGLEQFATKKGVTLDDVVAKVGSSQGPLLAGTKAQATRFHDDKDQYTGVYANGGPSTVGGTGQVSDISQICDRTGADVRGV